MLVKQLFVCSAFLANYCKAACVGRPGMRSVTIASLYNLSARANDHLELHARRAEYNHSTFQWHELSSAPVKIALSVFTHSKGSATVSTLLYFPSQVRTY